jgi:hypothetical protein
MMELDALVLGISPPFELQSTVVTGEVFRELELFGLKRSLHSPARERAVIVRTPIDWV